MAKVTLLTSREINDKFDLGKCKELNDFYSNDGSSYVNVYKGNEKGYGIAAMIGKEEVEGIFKKESDLKKAVEEVAKKIKPQEKDMGEFKAGVYVYNPNKKDSKKEDHYYYLAWEYPYKEDECEAKYEYLNAILEIVFENMDKEKKTIDFFNMYSHDQDFDMEFDNRDFNVEDNDSDVKKDDIDGLEKYEFLETLFDKIDESKGRIKLFQHNGSFRSIRDSFPTEMLK